MVVDTHIYQPLRSGRIWHKVNFKAEFNSLNSEFSFSLTSCLTKAEEPSLSYYLPIVGGRVIGFIPFPRVLVLYEMHLAWSRIWTLVAVSISYDDNNYTTGTLIPTGLTLSNIRLVWRVLCSNLRKGVALSTTSRCSIYWKGSLLVAFDYGRQLYFLLFMAYQRLEVS